MYFEFRLGHVWSDGTPVSYINWDIGQPDSFDGREECTQRLGELGYWTDVYCEVTKPFVCKQSVGKFSSYYLKDIKLLSKSSNKMSISLK